jgi:hypothetical protein
LIWRCEKSHCPNEIRVISGSIASLLCALDVQFSDPARTKPKHAEAVLGMLEPKSESGRAGGPRDVCTRRELKCENPCLSVSTRRARARPPCQRPSRHVAAGPWLNRHFVQKQDTFCPERHNPSSVFISTETVFINTAFVFANTVILFVITETVFASKGFVFANRTFVWINRVAVFASSIVVFAFTMIVFGNTGIVSRITKALFASGNIVFAIRPFVPAIKSFPAPVK